MDDILNACFNKDLFNTPLRQLKGKREHRIETNCKYTFTDTLLPIYESHKVSKLEIPVLECRSTHEVAPRNPRIKDEDLLYYYFSKYDSDTAFM